METPLPSRPVVGLLGATGITGRVALDHLLTRAAEDGVDVLVGARDPDRVRERYEERGLPGPEIVRVDLSDPATVAPFVVSADVVLNLAGPYTPLAPPVIDACLAHGTHYVDLTGEAPLAHRSDLLHERARAAGVAIVHTAGFEALPADVLVDAARRHAAAAGETLQSADLVTRVRVPAGTGREETISGGTAQSLVEVLRDRQPARASDPAARLAGIAPRPGSAADPDAVRRRSPIRLRPRRAAGEVLAPMTPLASINPPVVHRTQALSPVAGAAATPLAFREATSLGSWGGAAGWARLFAAWLAAATQQSAILATRLPHPARARLADVLSRRLPPSGSGPQGDVLTGWSWETRGRFTTHEGGRFHGVLRAEGNPGYGTTAWMAAELALHMAQGVPETALGSSTPALALDGHLEALIPARVRIRLGE